MQANELKQAIANYINSNNYSQKATDLTSDGTNYIYFTASKLDAFTVVGKDVFYLIKDDVCAEMNLELVSRSFSPQKATRPDFYAVTFRLKSR